MEVKDRQHVLHREFVLDNAEKRIVYASIGKEQKIPR
jgi:hypothetical protein